ncbi:transferase, partial [Nonomuraea wenchangensis]
GPLVPGTPARLVPALAVAAGAAWAGLTAEFAWRRIAPGPRTPDELWRMAVTSVVIPPVACLHRMRGEWKVRR